MIALAAVLAVVYLRGVARLARRGRRWKRERSWAFLAGCAFLATAGFISDATFTGHMLEHLLLAMAAPFFLALGAPITLVLQTAGPATRSAVRRALHSRVAQVIAHPVVGWLLFGSTLIAVYFSPLPRHRRARHVRPRPPAHPPRAGREPVPLAPRRRRPHARATAVRGAHAGAPRRRAVPRLPRRGVVVDPLALAPDVYPSLADQHRAAGLLWASGEIFTLVVAVMVFRQWFAADKRLAIRLERRIFGESSADHLADSGRR